MSICPKNKTSKARRDKRRANWKMSAPNLVKCSKCGALMMPHRVCKACGSYNKKEIIKIEINQKNGILHRVLFFIVLKIQIISGNKTKLFKLHKTKYILTK